MLQQFLVNFHFFTGAQTIRYFDNINPVQEGFVILIVAEGLPFGLVTVCQNNAIKRQGRQPFGAIVVTFLGRGQQWMQHLNWRFEHLHKFHQALIGTAKRTGIAVGIGIVLGKVLQLTDIDFTDQGGNILIVFISRFGFGDGELIQNRGIAFHNPELTDIAIEFMQSFTGPG